MTKSNPSISNPSSKSVLPVKSRTMGNETNQNRTESIFRSLNDILDDVLTPQFYGNASIQFTVQDGIIQTIRSSVEKSIR